MKTISKKDLVVRIADRTNAKQTMVKTVVQQFLDEITTELALDNRLEFRDFGVFEPHERKARTAQNPRTLEKVQVPAKRTAKFKMGRAVGMKLNNGMKP